MALPSHCLSLFSGYGGLDLGLKLACGARTVGYVEREAFAAATLVARMEDEALDDAPVWDDVATFDGNPWRGVVDCVVGGSPCQGNSIAGNGLGLDDPRSALWAEQLRITAEADVPWVWWENVGGAIEHALGVVTSDLEGLGFRVAPCVVSAADVGAPHRRERLFVLGYSERAGRRPLREGIGDVLLQAIASGPREATDGAGRHLAHAWPPRRNDWDSWRNWVGPQPAIHRESNGAPGGVGATVRAGSLRLLGNGVVPQQAAAAFLVCLGRLLT